MAANLELAKHMNVSTENIAKINDLHINRDDIESKIKLAVTENRDVALLLAEWRLNEYTLQRLWGFPENENYFREWNIPCCTCPKIDNEDRYPSNHYYYSGTCPIHTQFSNKNQWK